MDVYTDIWDYATDHQGLITTKEAEALGVTKQHLVTMAVRGALLRVGRGVYQVKHHAYSETDAYVQSVAAVGADAYLRGASVVALWNLCPTNPGVVYVGSPRRVRRKLPDNLRLSDRVPCDCVEYQGVRCEPIRLALRTAREEGAIEGDRIAEAAAKAVEKGLMTDEQAAEFKE